MKTNKQIVYYCAFIFLIALVIRIFAVTFFPQEASDTGEYLKLSYYLRTTGILSDDGITPDDSRAPLYPFYCALIEKISHSSLIAIRLSQALLDSLSCIIYFVISLLLFKSKRIALLTAFLYAFHPSLIGSTTFILSETLTIFLLSLTLLFILTALKSPKIYISSFAGFFLGLATLARPVTLPYPIFALFLLISLRKLNKDTLVKFLLFFILFILTIAPWTIRNYKHFNTFIPVSSNLGGNLYIGSNNLWNGSYHEDMVKLRSTIRNSLPKKTIGDYHVDNELKKRALENIKNNPIQYIRLCFRRLIEMWVSIPGNKQLLASRKYLLIIISIYHLIISTLALFALFYLLKKKRLAMLQIIPLSFILFFTATHCALVALPRYRIPIVPMVIIYSGFALAYVVGISTDSMACKTSSAE